MTRLTDVSVEQLQRALDDASGKRPTQRLTAAIAYKNGVTQTELAGWFDVSRRTIYEWLTRLEEEPIPEAARDEPRPGRPGKLTAEQHSRLGERLQEPPTAVGYDDPSWTPALVQSYLADRFDVTYSRPSCRRLMKDAGLVYLEPEDSAATTHGEYWAELDGGDSASAGLWLPA